MTPRDSSKWRAFYAAALGWLFDGYESYVLVLVAAVAVRDVISPTDLHDLPTYIGGLLGATLLGWATGGVLCGVLCDYIGRKRTLMVSILCYALFTGVTAFAHSYWTLLAFRFMTGLGLGGEWGPGAALVAELGPRRPVAARARRYSPHTAVACSWPPPSGSSSPLSVRSHGGTCSSSASCPR